MGLFPISQVLSWVIFIYGTVFGSFANVVAYRVPRKESIVFPGSHCPECNHKLTAWELVPVLSWIVLRGKCRYCCMRISIRYPLLELGTGLLWVFAFHHGQGWGQAGVWMAFWLYLIMIMGTDLTAMLVPDVLSLPAAVIFLFGSGITHIQTWSMVIAGMIVGYGMIWIINLVSRGRMGLGDAKAYLSVGAMFGPWLTIESFILASLFGAVVGIALRIAGRLRPAQRIPFVPYIVMASVVTAFSGQALLQLYLSYIF